MSDSILTKEEILLDHFQNIATDLSADQLLSELRVLTSHYAKLLKNSSRLIRISDKNEHRLQSISAELELEKVKVEKIAGQLSKYLPKQIYESLFNGNQADEIKTERKLLTVFFSDIQGFTNTSSLLQPEVLTKYINLYFTELSNIATKHGATIDKFIGDSMMAFFGDPDTKGDKEDALACVRMSLEIQSRLSVLNTEWQNQGLQHPFVTRIGIHTGWCNVGNFGSSNRMSYTIIGGEVNLAARIESVAEPGGILISSDTYALIKDHVKVMNKDVLTLKGINRPIQTYSVTNILDDGHVDMSTLHIRVSKNDTFNISTPDLTLQERLSLLEDLKRAVHKLEAVSKG